ncbi:MAG: recombinase family protein [Ruminococcus sp.]|nr:recombinase family protein [Ruminococcus sp.]
MGTLVNHKTVTSKIYKIKSTVPEAEQYRHEEFLPAIIDKQTYEQAQKLLESCKKSNVRASNGRAIHRYCGLIKCAECGAILITKRRQWHDTE